METELGNVVVELRLRRLLVLVFFGGVRWWDAGILVGTGAIKELCHLFEGTVLGLNEVEEHDGADDKDAADPKDVPLPRDGVESNWI